MSETDKATQPAAASEKPQEVTNGTAPAPAKETPAEKPTETPADAPAAAPASSSTPAEPAKEDAVEEKKDSSKPEAQEPAKKDEPEAPVDNRPEYLKKNPALSQFFERLSPILEKTGHKEMWGVTLKDSDDVPTVNVMIKFLRANEGNVKLAEEQLTKALEWRKKMDPLSLAENATFKASKFDGLGYVATYKDPKAGNVVFTWNIYGVVKDADKTFGDLDEFIKWRVALMELAIRELKLNEATTVMDFNAEDPYQMIQVHDYLNVSFLRMNSNIRAASKQTIDVFSTAYPELLKEKFFVNVPLVMGWVFTMIKAFLSKNTVRKFHPITNGVNLAREFPGFGDAIPKAYGGKGAELAESARTVSLEKDAPETPAAETPAAEASSAPAAAEKKEEKKEEKIEEEQKKDAPESSKAAETPEQTEKPEEKPEDKPAADKPAAVSAEEPVAN